MNKKIFILCGHPDADSTAGRLANSYEEGARKAGHEVRRTNLGDLQFDPILHKGYKVIQELEPDLKKIQEDMAWASHIVVAYPNWCGGMPALLKGMFDRMLLPGFGFRFKRGSVMWQRLLKGRTARVIVTMDNYPILARILFGAPANEIKRAILNFCGVWPVRVFYMGPVKLMSDARKEKTFKKVYRLGLKGK